MPPDPILDMLREVIRADVIRRQPRTKSPHDRRIARLRRWARANEIRARREVPTVNDTDRR